MQMNHPNKIYVELTTRCNLQCSMCVKYTPGSCIPERDLDLQTFYNLLPSLAGTETLILNGIGESLLHPHLAEIIGLARDQMPNGSSIGLQSNGLLLDEHAAHNLIKQGLSTLCLSVDRFDDPSSTHSTSEHSFSAVKQAVKSISRAREQVDQIFSLGLEIVLTRENIQDLPGLVRWGINNGIDYILTSHLLFYGKGAEEQNLFNHHSPEAINLFHKYKGYAAARGIDFIQGIKNFRKYAGTKDNLSFSNLLSQFNTEARERDLQFDFDNLDLILQGKYEETADIFDRAKQTADKHNIDLFLPPLQSLTQRECRFIIENTTFIDANGDVMPCHFLWHTYSCRMLNEDLSIRKRIFGNISNQSLEQIWQSRPYIRFRQEAGQYEYSSCWTCPQGPCPSLVNDESGYGNDCYGSSVPCGHCQWNLGGIHCL